MKAKRIAGFSLICVLTAASLVSVFWTPYPVLETDSAEVLLPPAVFVQGTWHIAGTDNLGRDIASRLMAGARFSLLTAVAVVAIAASVGSILGMIAGYAGGAADYVIMRLTDALSAFPGILLALVMVSTLGGGRGALAASLAVVFTPSYTRLSRIASSSLRGSQFIVRERVLGAGRVRILLCHILPNAVSVIFPAIIVGLSNAILAECAMSFLGLGAKAPAPSWGQMMSDAGQCILTAPWYAAITGSVITVAVVSFNLLAGGITSGK